MAVYNHEVLLTGFVNQTEWLDKKLNIPDCIYGPLSPSQTRGYDYLRPATTYDRQGSWAVAVIFTTIVRAVTHYDRFTTGLQ